MLSSWKNKCLQDSSRQDTLGKWEPNPNLKNLPHLNVSFGVERLSPLLRLRDPGNISMTARGTGLEAWTGARGDLHGTRWTAKESGICRDHKDHFAEHDFCSVLTPPPPGRPSSWQVLVCRMLFSNGVEQQRQGPWESEEAVSTLSKSQPSVSMPSGRSL